MESCCHYRNIRPWGYIAAKEQYDVLKTLVADLQDERHQVMLQGIDIVTSSGNSYHISIDIFPMSMIDGKVYCNKFKFIALIVIIIPIQVIKELLGLGGAYWGAIQLLNQKIQLTSHLSFSSATKSTKIRAIIK